MPNPFYYGGRVNPDQFVGRHAELQRIFAGLEVAHTGQMQSFSIVGPRRIGKSSLLFYISQRYSKYLSESSKYRFAYIDLQDASTLTPDGLFRKILAELGAPPNNNAKLTLAKFQDAITALKEGGALPVILLDEFEQLLDHAGMTAPDLFDSWRSLMSASATAFITASKTSLIDLADRQKITSPFFNIFTFLPLGEFSDDEALELIDRGVNADCSFGTGERNQMSTWAGNHPYKLQLAGALIYDAKVDGGLIDWEELRRKFFVQLEQVGLTTSAGRALKQVGRARPKARLLLALNPAFKN